MDEYTERTLERLARDARAADEATRKVIEDMMAVPVGLADDTSLGDLKAKAEKLEEARLRFADLFGHAESMMERERKSENVVRKTDEIGENVPAEMQEGETMNDPIGTLNWMLDKLTEDEELSLEFWFGGARGHIQYYEGAYRVVVAFRGSTERIKVPELRFEDNEGPCLHAEGQANEVYLDDFKGAELQYDDAPVCNIDRYRGMKILDAVIYRDLLGEGE